MEFVNHQGFKSISNRIDIPELTSIQSQKEIYPVQPRMHRRSRYDVALAISLPSESEIPHKRPKLEY